MWTCFPLMELTTAPGRKRMSTTLLVRSFGLVGYRHVSEHFAEGATIFRIDQPRDRLRCSQCGAANVWIAGGHERVFHNLPLRCQQCQTVRQSKIGFADPKKHYTRSFERYALELSRHMTIQDVADHLHVGWDTIKDIQAKNLQRRFSNPKLHKLKQIAIDEINVGKGHHYLTIVLNLLTGAVVFVGDGKGVKSLEIFWKRLRRARDRK